MEEFSTLTHELRNIFINEYERLKQEFMGDEDSEEMEEYNFDEEFEDDFEDIDDDELDKILDDFLEEEEDRFEKNIYLKLDQFIKNSEYKNIFYLIFLNDIYEFLKVKLISNSCIQKYELEILEKLENHDLKDLIRKLDESEIFFLDIMTIFLEYHYSNSISKRMKNRKIVKLSSKEFKNKFLISFLDDMQYKYEEEKRRKK